MPRPGRMTTERAKDFKGTLLQLVRNLGRYRLSLVTAIVFAILSTIFNIAGPKVLAKATTLLPPAGSPTARHRQHRLCVYRPHPAVFAGHVPAEQRLQLYSGWLMTGLFPESLLRLPQADQRKRSTACPLPILKSAPWARCCPASPTMWTRWARA